MSDKSDAKRYLIIPDPQCKVGAPTHHIDACANAIVEYLPDAVIHIGDHWDNPSLSKHEAPGSKWKEGTRIKDDIDVGNDCFERLDGPMRRESERRVASHLKRWVPERHFFMGNHEHRIDRLITELPQFDGLLSSELLKVPEGWVSHPFLEIVELDGILFSHYFSNTQSGKAIGGSIDNRLNKIGQSFVMGHQQGLQYGIRQYPGQRQMHGLVCGSFYLHDEHYRDRQSNGEWRGIVVLNEVHDGMYDIMPLSMKYLLRRFGP